jgi:hypothetical protein
MRQRWPIIAFTGMATAGKTTALHAVLPANWAGRFSFANPLREMLKVIGVPDVNLYEHKTDPLPQFGGKSARELLQTLGTQWGRDMVHQDIWAHAGEMAMTRMLAAGIEVLIDDARFDNEAAVIRKLGGVVIEVVRPGLVRGSHASERGINPKLIDHVVRNDGTTEDFVNRVCKLCLVCV